MITFNPSFGAAPRAPKTFSRIAKYNNSNASMHININSEAPGSYNLNITSVGKDGKPLSGYGETFRSGSIQEFKEWAAGALNKVKNSCADNKVVEDMQKFFVDISK